MTQKAITTMFTRSLRHCLPVLALLVAAIAACNPATSQPAPPAASSIPAIPGATPAVPPSAPATGTAAATAQAGRPGSFALDDPAAGLDALAAYQATLRITFDGTRDGRPYAWSQTFALTVTTRPAASMLTIESTGLDADEASPWMMMGTVDGVSYTRLDPEAPCAAEPSDAAAADGLIQPAGLLPPVTGDPAPEDGTGWAHYRFDEGALDPGTGVRAQGEFWVAGMNPTLRRYALTVTGGPEYFGAGIEGVQTWAYELIFPYAAQVALPTGCPFGMVDVPLPDGAEDVRSDPGWLTFHTATTVMGVAQFYVDELPLRGWDLVDGPNTYVHGADLSFARGEQWLIIELAIDTDTRALLALEPASEMPPTPEPTPTVNPTETAAAHLGDRIANALDVTLGTEKHPGPFPSYHLVLSGTLPSWDRDRARVMTKTLALAADVAGSDVHFFDGGYTDAPPASPHEYYVIGEDGFEVVAGEAQMSFTAIMVWSFWPLDVQFPLSMGALGPTPQGSVDWGGRVADVYALDTAGADRMALAALEQLTRIKAAHGTIWIDHESGALLKLVLDYDQELVAEPGGPAMAIAPGHIAIAVTQVGQVTVTPP
jgi:hypothetical protein